MWAFAGDKLGFTSPMQDVFTSLLLEVLHKLTALQSSPEPFAALATDGSPSKGNHDRVCRGTERVDPQ